MGVISRDCWIVGPRTSRFVIGEMKIPRVLSTSCGKERVGHRNFSTPCWIFNVRKQDVHEFFTSENKVAVTVYYKDA